MQFTTLAGLLSLHKKEDEVWAELWPAATSDKRIRRVLGFVDEASHQQTTDDGRAISAIAARIFNTTAGSLAQALTGYHRQGGLLWSVEFYRRSS
jgi:hypothetical protein